MATEALETCPSCKTGILLSTEEMASGPTKRFSCGHTCYSVEFEAKLSASVDFGFEHRLGPHSTHPVGGSIGAVVVSMQ
jgi:hypothetical protein